MRRLETMKNPAAMAPLLPKTHFSVKRNKDPLEKWLILGLGQEMNKRSHVQPVYVSATTGSTDVIKDYGIVSQRTQAPA